MAQVVYMPFPSVEPRAQPPGDYQTAKAAPRKVCSRCKHSLDAGCFGRHAHESDGLRKWCKTCEAAYKKEYRSRPETVKLECERSKRYRLDNIDAIKIAEKQYYLDHRNKRLAASKRWQQDNRDRWREHQRTYMKLRYAADPVVRDRVKINNKKRLQEKRQEVSDQMRAYRKTAQGKATASAAEHKRRARKREAIGTVSSKDIARILSAERCHVCGERFTTARPATLDHVIPLSKSGKHETSNLAASHRDCNSRKHAKLYNPLTGQGMLL